MDGLTIAGEDVLDDDTLFCVFEEWLYPVGLVEKFWNQIPVHAEVLIIVCALLFCLDGVAIVVGIGREITAFILKIIRFETDATARQVRIAFQHLSAQVEHHVGLVKMVFDNHQHIVGSHLGTVKCVADMEHCAFNRFRGLVPSLFAHYFARLREP